MPDASRTQHRSGPSAAPTPGGPARNAEHAGEPAGVEGDTRRSVEAALARRVIAYSAAAVSGLAVGAEFHAAVTILETCARSGGTVLVTGLGKSGLIGAKISATLASLGIPSHFVHPTEAAHGDLGNFRRSDVAIALSYSGETEEVVTLASILKQDGVRVISITAGPPAPGSPPSGLAKASDVALFTGRVEEGEQAAGLSPAPMASTTATLVLGDALAECAAHRLGAVDDFHRRHPGGSLGELSKPVMDIVRFVAGKSLFTVPDDVTVSDALKQSEPPGGQGSPLRRAGAMLLIDRATGCLTGLFTDGDLRRLVERDRAALDRPVRDVMTKSPGTLPASALVRDAVRMVRQFRRDEVPVVDDAGRPVGLLDVQDLVAMRLVKEER
ncbi:MAG TPA: SIS domain-containing protein [Phycisphaerales bacterium]|nr:SIS domain-containing protein [Phycisphaerales bacterium]